MPVELFDHDRITISRELPSTGAEQKHYYGGSARDHEIRFVNAERPCHVVYLLDTADPMVPEYLQNIRFLPLVHGFQYCSNGDDFIYRMLNEQEVEVIAPARLKFDEDFPYPDFPPHFNKEAVAFERSTHKAQDAETALNYQGVFGIDQLSESEMKRAVEIARSTWHPETFEGFDWSDEDYVRILGRAPFVQDRPSASCCNPHCTAEVDRIIEAHEFELPPKAAKLIGKKTIQIGQKVIRVPTLKTIAIHQPDEDDETMWGSPYVQLAWQLCSECGCITASNQCT